MPESLGPILERESRSVHLPDDAFDGMLKRRNRKRRRQRIGAAVTALVVAAALLAGIVTAVRDRAAIVPGTEPITTSTVESLSEVWSARVGDTSTPATTGDVLAEADRAGHLEAFSIMCQGSCSPLWTAEVGAMPVGTDPTDDWIQWWPGAADQPNAGYRSGSLTATDGVIYVMSADGTLRAFNASCRRDGGTCTPLWTAATGNTGSDMSLPIVADGRVLVSGNGGITSYAVGCAQDGNACRPLWHRPIVGAARAQDGHLYVTEVATGTAMELNPGTGASVWKSDPNQCCGNTPAPVRLGDRIYVNFGHLLAAYPTTCVGSCAPVWSIPIADAFSDGPQLVGDTLVLSTAANQQIGGLWFIPLACAEPGSGCEKGTWVTTPGELTTQQPVSGGTDVYASSTRNGGFWIFDASTCARVGDPCLPVASETRVSVVAPYTPVVVNDLVFVTDASGPLRVFGTACTGPCPSLWSSPGMRATGAPLVAGSHAFVSDRSGVLHAYATGGPVSSGSTASAQSSSPGAAPWFYLGLAIVMAGAYTIRRRRLATR